MALIQYLIIGLVTTQDKALNALGLLDQLAEQRRQEVIAEFELSGQTAAESANVQLMTSPPQTAPLTNAT
ncbi:MAG: hypothetical protein ACKVHE_18820 [Planctomycetales bacterium]|jgi:hypothetical protein